MLSELFQLLFCINSVYALYTISQGYNETEAKYLLKLSAGAYGQPEDINACLNSQPANGGIRTILDVNKENCDALDNPCEGYIAVTDSEKLLHAVFRGTRTNSQLLLEGIATTVPGEDFFGMGEVNKYFLRGHNLLWPDLETILRDPRYSDYTIVFTGHSLGGALAALAAARTAREGIRSSNRIKLVTFGEPRVGTRTFAMNFDNIVTNSYRVVYRKDIVPHSPGCTKDRSNPNLTDKDSLPCEPLDLNGPYHHGVEIWYPESMTNNSFYIECLGQPIHEDFGCSNQFKYNIKYFSDYVYDHRHYFGVKVPEYGKTGCNNNFPEGY
ncbi:unnamed protein product [Auanema sp. JU1783]|nr:unnamed protein product [Auanema sp. JU1783]